MTKGKWRDEQDAGMDTYHIRMTAAHARAARKWMKGNLSAAVRWLIEKHEGFVERRTGPKDRRKG